MREMAAIGREMPRPDGGPGARPRATIGRARARLLDWLDDGHVQPGELLPSERQLATLLQLDRGTLRRAIKQVEQAGQLQRDGRRLMRPSASAHHGQLDWMKQSIAVLVPHAGADAQSRNEWGRYVTMGALDAVRSVGRHIITINADALSASDLRPLVAARPMGVLLPELVWAPERVRQAAEAFSDAGIPVVVYGDEPWMARFDRVVSDHESGSAMLTRALLDLGRRPARFWREPHDMWWLDARSMGYVRAVTEAGATPLAVLNFPMIATHHTEPAGFEQSVRHLAGFLIDAVRGPQRVDALMVTSDRDAFYTAAAIRLIGLVPGRDVLIAGYDNYHHLCSERTFEPLPGLITIDKHNERMGREMLELLNERLTGALPAGPAVRRIKPELVRVPE